MSGESSVGKPSCFNWYVHRLPYVLSYVSYGYVTISMVRSAGTSKKSQCDSRAGRKLLISHIVEDGDVLKFLKDRLPLYQQLEQFCKPFGELEVDFENREVAVFRTETVTEWEVHFHCSWTHELNAIWRYKRQYQNHWPKFKTSLMSFPGNILIIYTRILSSPLQNHSKCIFSHQ